MTKTTETKPVKFFTNEYDVDMLEIPMALRSVFISVKKALAILDTNDDAELITEIKKHGRTMYSITYKGTDKKFTVGMNKIDTVLANRSGILLALHANIDTTKQEA